MKIQKQAFTLVELIVVITILAILWTIAFISLQWYSTQARDSTRLSDISTMKTSLELFHLWAWKYPVPTDWVAITYSWWTVWTQWTFWASVFVNVDKLDKIPTDPLTDKKYTYSVTTNEYELAWMLEWDPLTFNPYMLDGAFAWTVEATAIVEWNYNGLMTKTLTWASTCYALALPTIIANDVSNPDLLQIMTNERLVYNWYKNLPSNLSSTKFDTTGWFAFGSGVPVVAYTDNASCTALTDTTDSTARVSLVNGLQTAYTSTVLEWVWEVDKLINLSAWEEESYAASFVNNNLGGNVKIELSSGWEVVSAWLIDQITCESADWLWVSTDVYIWTTQWVWFCISPRYWDWNLDSTLWDWWISWNWWGNSVTFSYYEWWDATSIDDSWNINWDKWQTKILDSSTSYNCLAIGWWATDVIGWDTIVWRMKWLANTWNDYIAAQSIDWVTWITPANWHAIPALFLADCIDWIKDLWMDMTYTHVDNNTDLILYSDYMADEITDTNSTGRSNIIYQDRQKYLTAWTQKSWSHLPSAYSYINDWSAWPCDASPFWWCDWSDMTSDQRWEYQIACDLWLNINLEWTDSSNSEWIWLSSVGSISASYWSYYARVVWISSCSWQNAGYTGVRNSSNSARFVVRP
jgi:prepilin-type N-terminal cleavage/methylation domain-containing protein